LCFYEPNPKYLSSNGTINANYTASLWIINS